MVLTCFLKRLELVSIFLFFPFFFLTGCQLWNPIGYYLTWPHHRPLSWIMGSNTANYSTLLKIATFSIYSFLGSSQLCQFFLTNFSQTPPSPPPSPPYQWIAIFFFLATPWIKQDLSCLTRDLTCTPHHINGYVLTTGLPGSPWTSNFSTHYESLEEVALKCRFSVPTPRNINSFSLRDSQEPVVLKKQFR